jgi:hypothetical protein
MTLNIPELKLGFAHFSPKEINNHHGFKRCNANKGDIPSTKRKNFNHLRKNNICTRVVLSV